MTPGRLRKKISRALMVSWREQPTRYDIEALHTNIRQVGLVVRVRWTLIGVLVIFSIFAASLYATRMSVPELAQRMTIPALALGVVVIYNAFYTANYRRLGNIAVWNNLQLALDAVVVTVLIYFSGGVISWFWSMYSLFILEAAFILRRPREVWLQAVWCVMLLGSIEGSVFLGILPHQAMPFGSPGLETDAVYVAVRYLWQVAVLMGTAWVSTQLVGESRRRRAAHESRVLIDEGTSLYSRSYFLRAANAETRRAVRDRRSLHIMLIDIDHFGRFNERFGFEAGDQLLGRLATTITETIGYAGDVTLTTNVAARYGGEEFVVLLAEDARLDGAPSAEDALALAEQLRRSISEVRVNSAGVTVSIGVASLPDDGTSVDALLDVADAALVCAIEQGGNRVVAGSECALGSQDEADFSAQV